MKRLLSISIMCLLAAALHAQQKYTLTVSTMPQAMASVNISYKDPGGNYAYTQTGSVQIEAGSEVEVNLYDFHADGWKETEWRVTKGSVTLSGNSYNNTKKFTMPAQDVSLVAIMEYNPDNPNNPLPNAWYPDEGKLVIDYLGGGSFDSALRSLIPESEDYKLVKTVIVGGYTSYFTEYDFDVDRFPYLHYLDLSRVNSSSWRSIYSGSDKPWTELLLPPTITEIGGRAFENTFLEKLTLYSTTPPKLMMEDVRDEQGNVIGQQQTSFPSSLGMTVYVPEESVPLYLADPGWSSFDIQPIIEDAATIYLHIMGTKGDDRRKPYAGMTLELLNVKNLVKRTMIMTSRQYYAFGGLPKNTVYQLRLVSPTGNAAFEVDNIVLDGNKDIYVDELKRVWNLTLTADNGGTPLTDEQFDCLWLDRNGHVMSRNKRLSYAFDDERVRAVFTLTDPALKGVYRERDTVIVERVGDQPWLPIDEYRFADTRYVNYTLKPIPTYSITTTVGREDKELLDRKVKQTIYRITGSGSEKVSEQTFATITAQGTVSSGPQAPLPEGTYDITVSVEGTNLNTATQRIALNGDKQVSFSLKEMLGSTISIDWKHFDVADEGVDVSNARGAARSVDGASITLRNITDGIDISDFAVGSSSIRLHEKLKPGTEIELTLGSRLGASFTPVTLRQKADADGNVKMAFTTRDYGSLHVSFRQTECTSVVVKLFGDDGQLRASAKAADANETTFTLLPDGKYTVVFMDGSSSITNAMNTLADIERFLSEGRDYTAGEVLVSSGTTTGAQIDYVPVMGNNVQLYTNSGGTRVTPKKSIVGAGTYQTISTNVVFRPEYKGRITQLQAEFDIPEDKMHFVAGSVLLDNATTPYNIKNGKLTVPLIENRLMRYVVVPLAEGEMTMNGRLSFLLDGELVEQPLPSTPFTVQGLSFNVPERVSTEDITISGAALPNTLVYIYQNGAEVAQTMSNSAGEWSVDCTLEGTGNKAMNTFYASYITSDGYVMKTDTKKVTVDRYGIFATQVVMSHYNGWTKFAESVVFDLTTNKANRTSYPFYHEATFNFGVTLNVSDTTNIDDVILFVYTSDGEARHYSTTWNEKTKTWRCSDVFNSMALPASVAVNVVHHAPDVVGEKNFLDEIHELDYIENDYQAELADSEQQIAALDRLDADSDEHEAALRTLMINNGLYPEDLGPSPYPNTQQGLQQMMEDAGDAINAYERALAIADSFDYSDDFTPVSVHDIGTQIPGLTFSTIPASARRYCEALSRGESPARLPEAGPNEEEYTVDCEDGSKIVCRMHDNGYTLLLPFADLMIVADYDAMPAEIRAASMELRNAMATARAAQNGPMRSGGAFAASMMSYVDTVYNALNNLSNVISSFIELIQKYAGDKISGAKETIRNMKLELKGHENVYWYMNPNRELFKDTQIGRKQLQQLNDMQKQVAQKCAALRAYTGKMQKLFAAAGKLGKVLSALGIISDVVDFVNAVERTISLYNAVPDPCKLQPEKASSIKNRIVGFGLGRMAQKGISLYSNISAVAAAVGGTAAAPTTFGGSAALGWAYAIGVQVAKLGINFACDKFYSHFFNDIEREINSLKCDSTECRPANSEKCCKGENCKPNPKKPGPPNPRVTPILDPSGYVYEAVADNRVSNALATIYYKDIYEDMYGDQHEQVVMWRAEDFDQVNPMLTDENGEYGWDVPSGLWQVRVTKDGYDNTESEWLPVPPPQLDVNLPMTQPSAPVVSRVRAMEQGVEVLFDKYMKPAHLTADNIFVTRGAQKLDGTIRLMDQQLTPDSVRSYARRVMFVPAEKLNIGENIRLTVRAGVESYASVGMTDDFTQDFNVAQHVSEIACDSIIGIVDGDTQPLVIRAMPAAAAAGKKLTVTSLDNNIAHIDATELTFDSQGRATLNVKGQSIGTTALRLQMADDPEIESYTIVGVRSSADMVTRQPTASLINGVTVNYGTTLRLSSDTPDAVIYYTTDGTCPCDNPDRLRYDGSIVLTKDVTIKAIAIAPGYAESNVLTVSYRVLPDPQGISDVQSPTFSVQYYNLKGQKVDADTQRGIILTNGKKMVRTN